MLPQVGQGALAVECRVEDAETFERLAAVDSVDVRMAVTAERAFLDEMGSGCNLPVGAFGRLDGEEVVVEALLASLDGRIVLRHSVRGTDPQAAGRAVAAGLMDDRGGRVLLEESA